MRGLRPRSIAIFESWGTVLVSFVCGADDLLFALMPQLAIISREVGICRTELKRGHCSSDVWAAPSPHNKVLILGSLIDSCGSCGAAPRGQQHLSGDQRLAKFCKVPACATLKLSTGPSSWCLGRCWHELALTTPRFDRHGICFAYCVAQPCSSYSWIFTTLALLQL